MDDVNSNSQTNQTDKLPREGQGKRYKIRVDESKCISAASCMVVAMKTFALDKNGIPYILETSTQDTDEDHLLAAQSCPTGAIELIDTITGEKIWPR